MSGVRLAAGPRQPSGNHGGQADNGGSTVASSLGGLMGSVSIVNLQLIGFVVVFAVSGVVPVDDLLYPLLMAAYGIVLSRLVFPKKLGAMQQHVVEGSRFLQIYVGTGATLGLFLPLAYVLGSFTRNDQGAVVSATPHLFLLSCQILFEDLLLNHKSYSPPVRAIVTLLFNGRRLHLLHRWLMMEYARELAEGSGPYWGSWLWFGRGLAAANSAFWAFNFFCFLIPIYLPKAFSAYLVLPHPSPMPVAATSAERHPLPTASKPPQVEDDTVLEKIKVALTHDEKGTDKKLK